MKPSVTRLKMIAGVFGALCVSQPGLISAQGVPLKKLGTPVGENAVPVGEHAVPVAEDASPAGEDAVPIGEGAVPLSKGGIRVGEGAVPAGKNGISAGEGAVPTGKNGTPAGEDAVPTGKDGIPAGEDAVPAGKSGVSVGEDAVRVGEGAIPINENAALNEQAQQRRLQNREAAMNDPATSRFFEGDTGTRLGKVSGNLTAATGYPSNVTAPAIAQQDAEDRDWSLGAVTSAESRPPDLFTKDWWTAHPDVLDGTSRYYADKPASAWWQGSPWNELIRVLGMRNAIKPFKYVNDRNITFKNDVIYVNGQAVSSYEDFVTSARALANTHPEGIAERPGWFPLGTFAVSSSMKQKTSNHAIQLAMDAAGNIAGVYVNWPQGNVLPIGGSVDTNSQRVAFNIGGSDNIVIETGLANLTEPNTRVWVHLPSSHSQTWLITRIKSGGE
ncbi:MAG: hypothetical protein ABIS50_22640 [Luteolibacter sp.]|uniref:hypothetical protein n=1 Tax=Luteolibacter sp. TaxID=1962973 RepID=UPI0032675706